MNVSIERQGVVKGHVVGCNQLTQCILNVGLQQKSYFLVITYIIAAIISPLPFFLKEANSAYRVIEKPDLQIFSSWKVIGFFVCYKKADTCDSFHK